MAILERTAGTGGRPRLAPGERVLARLLDAAATPVVATTAAIYLDDGADAWRRLGWVDVTRVIWEPHRGLLRLDDLTGATACQVRLAAAVCPPLVALARERFGATLLTSALVALRGGRTAAVTARRVPGSPEVTWVVRLDHGTDHGTDHDDPDLEAQILAAIRHLRAEVGI